MISVNLDASDWIAACSAFIALLALVFSVVSARTAKKYTREQIQLATKQFIAEKIPDVEIKVFCQRKHPGTRNMGLGLFLEATNHSPDVTVNQLKVFLTVEPLADCKGVGFIFPTFADLKPNQTLKMQSLQDFQAVVPGILPDGYIESGEFIIDDVSSPFSQMEGYDAYPATVTIEYLPRVMGAEPVKRKQEMYLYVKHASEIHIA